MKIIQLNAFLILLVSFILLSSCRMEDEELINLDAQEQLLANSVLTDLIARVSFKDGSGDNILDKASCFTVQLPVTVFVQSSEINVASEADFNTVQEAINTAPNNLSILDFEYPITIILSDYTEVIINNETELEENVSLCSSGTDEDIECVDFQYPVSYSVFNQDNEFLEVVSITTDAAHYAFVLSIVAEDIISINFPFTLVFTDGSSLEVTSAVELQEAIENVIDTCDENDQVEEQVVIDGQNCDDCTVDQLTQALVGCATLTVGSFYEDGIDNTGGFSTFSFAFNGSGALSGEDTNTGPLTGSWSASGEGNELIFNVEVDLWPQLSQGWLVLEIITNDTESIIRLANGEDRLTLVCEQAVQNQIGVFLEDCPNLNILSFDANTGTTDFNLFFQDNGLLLASSSTLAFAGTWELTQFGGEDGVVLDLPDGASLGLNTTWTLDNIANGTIVLSNGSGSVLVLGCL